MLAAIPDYYILLCCYGHLMDCRIHQGTSRGHSSLLNAVKR
jgi:hypothetical protein